VRYCRLGASGLDVSHLGFGCARLGGVFGGSDERQLIVLLRAAQDAGINFFDTSDMYAQGESERILGHAFRRDRHRVVIATKTGYVLPPQGRLASLLKPALRPVVQRLGLKRSHVPHAIRGSLSQNFKSGHIRAAVERSLKRLQTDYIDLLQLHSPPLDVIRAGEFISTLEALVKEGKIRYHGISCEEADHVGSALEHPVSALQLRINLLNATAAERALRLAAAAGVGVIARECLGGGAFSKPASWLPGAVQSGAVAAADAVRIEQARADARQQGLTLGEAALRWVIRQPSISVVLLGMRDRAQLAENVSAAERFSEPRRQQAARADPRRA
jgi:aryl-alcohol dehydrogenase-like predicted oxidoreductase